MRWSPRKKLVRLHAYDGPSIEGVLVGNWSGHYLIATPKLLESEEVSYTLDGHLCVLKDRVLYMQVIG